MKVIYSVYGEDDIETYTKNNMWTRGKKDTILRVFRFDIIAKQCLFCIRTLRIFHKDMEVEIYTNKPDYEGFQNLHNVNVIDMSDVYNKYKHIPYWCYLIKFESFIRIDDDFFFLDNDTYIKGYFKPELKPNTIYTYGVVGMKKEVNDRMCGRLIKGIDTYDESAIPNRDVDNRIINPLVKEFKLDVHNCKRYIEHYHKNKELKNSVPPESVIPEIEKGYRRWKRIQP